MKRTKKTSPKNINSLPDEASLKTPVSKPAKSVPKTTPADKPTRPKPKSQSKPENKPDKARQVNQPAKKPRHQVTTSDADLPSEVEIYHETLKHFLMRVVAFFGGFALAVLFAVIFSVMLGINPLTE